MVSLDSIEDWGKILKPLKLVANKPSEPAQKLNRHEASNAALSGDNWHNNMLRLVGSWVAKGNTEEEIHKLAATHILPPHTAEKTHYEVQKMIDGAMSKGFAPQIIEFDANRNLYLSTLQRLN